MKKKYLYPFLLLNLMSLTPAIAQEQDWLWAKTTSNVAESSATAVATAPDGSVYTGGSFMQSSITFEDQTINHTGSYLNPFLVKYASDGTFLWAKGTSVNSETSDITGITTDNLGAIYVIGRFDGAIGFGDLSLTSTTFNSFIAKFDSDGNVIWLKKVGASNWTSISSIKLVENHIYVVGAYSGILEFSTETLVSNGESDIYVASYDVDGNLEWAESFGGTGIENGPDLAVDGDTNLYITGSFNSPTLNFADTTVTNAGQYDIFLIKFNGNQMPQWIKSYGGISSDWGVSLAADMSGNIFSSYMFTGAVTFEGNSLISTGYNDAVIVKYDSAGTFLWHKLLNGNATETISSLTCDNAGRVFFTGSSYSNNLGFGGNSYALTGVSSMFVGMLQPNGTPGLFVLAGEMDGTESNDIALDNDKVVVAGYAMDITFGDTTLDTGYEMFVAKMGPAALNTMQFENTNITLYPNPTKEILHINVMEDAGYSIIDVTGRIVTKGTSSNNTIDVSALPLGMYFLKTKNTTTKFIKE